jgi:hypothetical protein
VSSVDPLRPGRDRRRSPRGRALRRAAGGALVLLVFGIGVALGEALRDNPDPGGSRTRIQTVQPLPVGKPRETVTVTVPGP